MSFSVRNLKSENKTWSAQRLLGRLLFVMTLVMTLVVMAMTGAAYAGTHDTSPGDKNQESDLILVFNGTAATKVSPEVLDRILAQDKYEVIVHFEYELTPMHGASLERKKAIVSELKERFYNDFSDDEFEVLTDYETIPLVHIKMQEPDVLRRVLDHYLVKTVYELEELSPALAQSLTLINQPSVQAQGFLGDGTTVAVLDTGLNYKAAEFGGCERVGVPAETCRVVGALDVAPDDGALDDNGHGTSVAGIVASTAPGAKIISLDVFAEGRALNSHVLSAIDWVIRNKSKFNIVAFNMSLSVGGTQFDEGQCPIGWVNILFMEAWLAGIIPVVAAGNDGSSQGIGYPSCANPAVSVGNVYDQDVGGLAWGESVCTDVTTAPDRVACSSNSGKNLDLLAPGALITSSGATLGGTSMAAPFVSGAIAILRGLYPQETLARTVERLVQTGVPLKDAKSGVTTPRVDLFAAIEPTAVIEVDSDGDGYGDAKDNCPQTPNPAQIDLNRNGIGLVCDQDEIRAIMPPPKAIDQPLIVK